MSEAQKLFSDTLDIEETVVVVDARKGDSEGMTKLKEVLKKRREEMIVSYNLNNGMCVELAIYYINVSIMYELKDIVRTM